MAALCLSFFAVEAAAQQASGYTAAQAQCLSEEIGEAQEVFVQEIAALVEIDPAIVRAWMPSPDTPLPEGFLIFVELERVLGRPLSEAEKQQIRTIDAEKHGRIAAAREEVRSTC